MQLKHILGKILSVSALSAAGPIPIQQTQVTGLHGEISKSDAIDDSETFLYTRQSERRIAPALLKIEDLPLVIPGGIATPLLTRTEPSREPAESLKVVSDMGTDYNISNTVLPRDIDWSEIIKCALFWMFNSECLDSAKQSTAQRVSNMKALNEQANHSADVSTVGMDQARPETSSDAEHALSGHTTKMKPKHDQASDSEGYSENRTRALGSPKLLQRRHNKDNDPNHIIVCIVTFFIKC